jgi:hypothetical protein
MSNTFLPGPTPNTVRSAGGKILTAPKGWILFPSGDAALTRRVKAAGDHWVAQRSKELLARYRRGEANGEECPLQRALVGNDPGVEPDRTHLPFLSLKDADLGAGGDDSC